MKRSIRFNRPARMRHPLVTNAEAGCAHPCIISRLYFSLTSLAIEWTSTFHEQRGIMKKRILITTVAILGAAAANLSAAEYDLRANMLKLNAELGEIQRGIMNSDKGIVSAALGRFKEDVGDLLSDEGFSFKKKVYEMFPEEMKNKKHKVTVAMKAARTMETNIEKIQEAIDNKDQASELSRKRAAQDAYLNIAGACFECHNLVRDK